LDLRALLGRLGADGGKELAAARSGDGAGDGDESTT